eukprot:2642060-Rhodomonas_salina.7
MLRSAHDRRGTCRSHRPESLLPNHLPFTAHVSGASALDPTSNADLACLLCVCCAGEWVLARARRVPPAGAGAVRRGESERVVGESGGERGGVGAQERAACCCRRGTSAERRHALDVARVSPPSLFRVRFLSFPPLSPLLCFLCSPP